MKLNGVEISGLCSARESQNHRAYTDDERVLVCDVCGAAFPWFEHGDRLPLHEPQVSTPT